MSAITTKKGRGREKLAAVAVRLRAVELREAGAATLTLEAPDRTTIRLYLSPTEAKNLAAQLAPVSVARVPGTWE